jgi:hypothetical protein
MNIPQDPYKMLTPIEKLYMRSYEFAQNLANHYSAASMCDAIMKVEDMEGKKGEKARKNGMLILRHFSIDE